MSIATQIQQLLQDKQFELALQLAVSTQKLEFAIEWVQLCRSIQRDVCHLPNCNESSNQSV